MRHILPLVVFLLLATGASAQFSLNTVEPGANLQMPMNIHHSPFEVDVVNAAKARAIRKGIWRHRNKVDTKISFTGTMTQYNDAWSNNGGQNVVSGLILAYYYHTYGKNRFTFMFKFDGKYGMNLIDDIWFKNQDLLKLYGLTSWKVKTHGALKNWAYSFAATFTSQFSEGHKSRSEKILWSNFMAPGTLDGGFGLTYTSPKPKLPFIITIDPIAGNVLFVTDDRIDPDRRRNLGIPVTYAPDDAEKKFPLFKNYKAEGGSALTISFNRVFKFGESKKVSMQYNTVMRSFYGWITEISRYDPHNTEKTIYPTLNWMNTLNFNPLKYLTLQFTTTTVYDKSQIDKIQMQYFLSVGLTYSFKNKE